MKTNTYLKALLLGLLVCSSAASAKSRNVLFEQTPDHLFGPVNPVLINDFLIYQALDGTEGQLWSYDTTNHQREKIHTGYLNRFYPYEAHLYTLGNHAYFVSGLDENVRFWKTDGTAAGTEALSSPPLYPFHSLDDGFLYSWTLNGTTVVTDGTDVVEHEIDNPPTSNMCAHSLHDVMGIVDQYGPGEMRILRSQSGEVTVLSDLFPEDIDLRLATLIKSGNQCFVFARNYEENIELLRVPKEGPVQLLSDQFDISDFKSIKTYKDRLYIISYEDNRPAKIQRLNTTFDGFDAEYTVPEGFDILREVKVTHDFFLVRLGIQDANPPVSNTLLFDEDLAVVNSLSGLDEIPNIHPILSGDIFSSITYNSDRAPYTFTLRDDIDPDAPLLTRVEDSTVNQVITNANSPDVYLQVRRFNKVQMVRLADKPDINHSTAGVWHDPNIANQGLVVKRGQRADGSDYLFVSAYVMAEGEPLWLAGTININTPQSFIEIELAQFEGANFFEANVTPLQLSWGMVRLEMTSCDGLSARFNPVAGDSRTINLVRIDNTRFDGLCID